MRAARIVAAALLFASVAHAQNATDVATDNGEFGAGRAVLLVLLILLLGGLVYMGWSIRKMRRASAGEEDSEVEEVQGIGNAGQNRLNTWKIIHSELSLGRVLGQGSHGKVYKAEYRGVSVAVKEVVGSAMTDDDIATSMKILIQARHPNLVLLMGIARPPQKNGEKGRLFVVSEFMYRQSLFSVLHDSTVLLDWKSTIGLMKDVAKALMYMHQSSPPMLHRNLNSLNILVTEDLVAKIGDYGLDEVRRGCDEKPLTSLWNAPEVFKKSVHSKATDVFSFGIIMWEILTRRAPYQDGVAVVITPANMIKLVKNIMERDVRPRLPDNTPPGLASLINACWAATPETRPAPDEILFALEKLSKLNIVEPEIVVDRVRSGRVPSTCKKNFDTKLRTSLACCTTLLPARQPQCISFTRSRYKRPSRTLVGGKLDGRLQGAEVREFDRERRVWRRVDGAIPGTDGSIAYQTWNKNDQTQGKTT
jgi:serine/threonine protein kinase